MKRRDFLSSTAVAATAAAIENARATAQTSKDRATMTKAKPATSVEGIQVRFYGLNLFVIPKDPKQKWLDVGFIDTQKNPEVRKYVQPHRPTLRVPRGAVHVNSTAVPAVADLDYAYYSMLGPVSMVGTATAEASDGWNTAPSLQWKDTPPTDYNPTACPTGSDWKTLGWLLDFSALLANPALPANWKETAPFLGVLTLRAGDLETDAVIDDENCEKYTFVVGKNTRIIKDVVSCYVDKSVKFLQFKFGTVQSTSLILQCQGADDVVADIFHLPTPGMDPNPANGPLQDYWALYEALYPAGQLGNIKVTERPTVCDRKPKGCKCGTLNPAAIPAFQLTPRSGGCGAVRVSE